MLVPEIVAAGGGLLFAFDHATIAGKLVLTLLAIVSIFSWSIMITKLRVIRFARKQNARFLAAFRQDRQPLRLFQKNARFPGSPVFNVYRDRKSTRLNSSHSQISYAVFCLKKKNMKIELAEANRPRR